MSRTATSFEFDLNVIWIESDFQPEYSQIGFEFPSENPPICFPQNGIIVGEFINEWKIKTALRLYFFTDN